MQISFLSLEFCDFLILLRDNLFQTLDFFLIFKFRFYFFVQLSKKFLIFPGQSGARRVKLPNLFP